MGAFCSHPREETLKRNTSFIFQNSYKNVAFENESGDLCDQKVDAIVNVANNQLAHSSGLANTIVVKGGQTIQEESNKLVQETDDGTLEIGSAVVTSAGHLPAKYVIHVVCPIWNGGENGEEEKLAASVINALAKADEYKVTSIAVPSVSAGSFGFPKEKSASIMIKNCLEYIDSNPSTNIKVIRFVNMEVLTVKAFKTELETVLSNSTSSPCSPEKDFKVEEEAEERPVEEEVQAEETAVPAQTEEVTDAVQTEEAREEAREEAAVQEVQEGEQTFENKETGFEQAAEAKETGFEQTFENKETGFEQAFENKETEFEQAAEAKETAEEQAAENFEEQVQGEFVREENVPLEQQSPVEVTNDPQE